MMVIEATAVCGHALKDMSELHTELRSTLIASQPEQSTSPELHDTYIGLALMFFRCLFLKGLVQPGAHSCIVQEQPCAKKTTGRQKRG